MITLVLGAGVARADAGYVKRVLLALTSHKWLLQLFSRNRRCTKVPLPRQAQSRTNWMSNTHRRFFCPVLTQIGIQYALKHLRGIHKKAPIHDCRIVHGSLNQVNEIPKKITDSTRDISIRNVLFIKNTDVSSLKRSTLSR